MCFGEPSGLAMNFRHAKYLGARDKCSDERKICVRLIKTESDGLSSDADDPCVS